MLYNPAPAVFTADSEDAPATAVAAASVGVHQAPGKGVYFLDGDLGG